MTEIFSGSAVPFAALFVTIVVHLVTTVWWAASLTKRVEHIEKWIAGHEHTASRLASLEERIEHLSSGICRIEDFIRQRY